MDLPIEMGPGGFPFSMYETVPSTVSVIGVASECYLSLIPSGMTAQDFVFQGERAGVHTSVMCRKKHHTIVHTCNIHTNTNASPCFDVLRTLFSSRLGRILV